MLLIILPAPAARQPRMNETICVMADTCGRSAIRRVTERNTTTDDCLHHPSLTEGVRSPMSANMKLENPTASAEEQNHDAEAMANAHTRCDRG